MFGGLIAFMALVILAIVLIKYEDVVRHFFKMVFGWFKNRAKQKLANKQNGQVGLIGVDKMMKECKNRVKLGELDEMEAKDTLNDLNRLKSQGYENLIVDVDGNGKVGEWETAIGQDEQIARLKGEEDMVVVEN